MHKWTEKSVLSPCRVPISSSEASLDKQLPAESCDYCKLVNGWVWFESQMCRGWLQGHNLGYGLMHAWAQSYLHRKIIYLVMVKLLCYHPYLVSQLLQFCYPCISLQFFSLVYVTAFSSRCMLELKFAISHREAKGLSS